MSFSPMKTEDVSRFIEPGRGRCVEGDEVEIDLICCLIAADPALTWDEAGFSEQGCFADCVVTLTWV